MLLAACLIVKDGAGTLARCLDSVAGFVDEIVVYDTGSTDGTQQLAGDLGARVVDGYWDDDFARARNDALAAVTADWVLSIDADECASGVPAALRALLAGLAASVVAVERHDVLPGATGSYRFRTPRLFRRAGAVWTGRVHESVEVTDPSGLPGTLVSCSPDILRLAHDGYADPAEALAKARRNAELGLAEVNELRADPGTPPDRLARALVDLGRSLVAADEPATAVHAFDAVRMLVSGGTLWARATDHLARLALQAGRFDAASELSGELRAHGTDPQYCDWLLAQALAQNGSPEHAARLLAEITALVDPGGHVLELGQVAEFRALALALAGDQPAAARAMLAAMTNYGRVGERAALALSWWPGGTDELIAEARRIGGPHTDEAVAALVQVAAQPV
ncbi:MAG TPA: glycosyltransferase family 2 protein [Jatrophihabitantaceae bacterium]|nr:glycosyltransferase family 2 protein [Jatrophihabitantaceae bacterium]